MRRELVLLGVMSILFTPVFAETLEMNNMASFQMIVIGYHIILKHETHLSNVRRWLL